MTIAALRRVFYLHNPFEPEMQHLFGGAHYEVEATNFPKLRKRVLRRGDKAEVYDFAAPGPFGPVKS